MAGTNDRVRTDVQEMVGRLEGTNQELQTRARRHRPTSSPASRSTLSGQVGTLREALAAAARDTGQSHALLSDQVKTLRDVSTYVLRDIAAMAPQFGTQTRIAVATSTRSSPRRTS